MDYRIHFLEDPDKFFLRIKNFYSDSWRITAREAAVTERTLRSWRRRKTAMPFHLIEKWSREIPILPPRYRIVDLNKKRRVASSLGGEARQSMYGDLGTKESRKRGGLNSRKVHLKKDSSPFVARAINMPRKSEKLAELVGIILGDGSVTDYQLVIYSNVRDEKEYTAFLRSLIEELFSIRPSGVNYLSSGVCKTICSRKNVVRYLESIGIVGGNKTKRQVKVPQWVQQKRSYALACLRGLIDTDGCVYIDHHAINGRHYASRCIAFTNASMPLLDFVEETLKNEGFCPTRWGRHVRLRRQVDVQTYIKKIGFSNPKHLGKLGL